MKPSKMMRQRIKINRIEIIGIGGIGSIVSLFLSQFLNSLKCECEVYLVDGDLYEPRNKERMLFGRLGNKSVVKAEELSRQFGEFMRYRPIPEYITRVNIPNVIREGDIVFLCVDNHVTRLIVNNHCRNLRNVVLISGGNDGIENGKDGTFGNVQLYVRRDSCDATSPLTRFHSEIANAHDQVPGELGCDEMANQSAPQLLFTNLCVASAMLNVFYGYLRNEVTYEEVYLSITKGRMVPVSRHPGRAKATLQLTETR
jgi:molybdopterin/thiamine biosynthesis adenylyltransferase